MVGIAGKSKGCATCRRRKIRCDLLKPACVRCTKSGRQCEGYERYPVFIVRTVNGCKKRKWLEETKVARPAESWREHESDHSTPQERAGSWSTRLSSEESFSNSPPPNNNIDPLLLSTELNSTYDRSIEQLSSSFQLNINRPVSPLPPHNPTNRLPSNQHYEKHLISLFWDSYASSQSTISDVKRGFSWLHHCIHAANPAPVLHQTLLALSLTTLGRETANEDLLHQGQNAYSNALVQLQQALLDPQMSMDDDTLAAARAMLWYELLEATSGDGRSWYSHLSGVASLMRSRGPSSYRYPLAKAVFEDVRYALMMQALMQRTASPFGQPDWLTEPWQGQSKSFEQVINDYGFQIGALLQKSDDWIQNSDNLESTDTALTLLRECNDLYQTLQTLYNEKLAGIYSELQATDAEPKLSLKSQDSYYVTLVLTIWSLQLSLGFVADPLASHANTAHRCGTYSNVVDIDEVLQNSDKYCDDLKRSRIAHGLLQLVKSAVEDGLGQKVLSKTIFPLFCILWQFCQSRKMLAEVQDLKNRLSKQRGIRFAQSVSKGVTIFPHGAKDDGTLVCLRDGICCDTRCFPRTYMVRESYV